MVIKYNKTESDALTRKEERPKEIVVCPRCGRKLVYKEIGNSYEIKCPTDNCLKRTVRGL